MSIAINKQKNQPSITSIRIREVEKPRIKIKIQTTPNNKGKTMQDPIYRRLAADFAQTVSFIGQQ